MSTPRIACALILQSAIACSAEALVDSLEVSDAARVVASDGDSLSVVSRPRETFSAALLKNYPLATQALEFSARLDPVRDDTESTADIDAGIVLGMPADQREPNRFVERGPKVVLEFKEFADRTRFTIFLDGRCVSFWGRMRSSHGVPNIGTRQPGASYLLKIVAIPRGENTGLRFFVEHGDRPLRLFRYDDPVAGTEHGEFVTEWTLERSLAKENYLGLYVRESGKASAPVITSFSELSVRSLSIAEAERWMPSDEFVMANLNYDHPALTAVKATRDAGDLAEAKARLVHYFRTRTTPAGPEYDREMARDGHNWQEVSDNALRGIYSKLSWFHEFSEPGELSRPNGLPRWERDPGFLTRHFHWVVMAHAFRESGDERYARRVAEEVIDYVREEPTIYWDNPNLGGQLDVIDGSVLAEHLLWTGNVGRRLELTWWQTFEVLRKTDAFSNEAIFHFLDGVIRQCRLQTNPTVFQEWDDSGLHGALALAKSSILFPMADEAALWRRIGFDRIDRVLDVQFHPDGSHVSLSTGYEWATIDGFREFYEYLTSSGAEVPEKLAARIEDMFAHPLAITRPDFGSVDLNDGTWNNFTDRARDALALFPDRDDYRFFATEGEEGTAPEPVSMYFPNAGQYVFRTGWGDDEQYLFFGAGPWGASHGKMDALNIYAAYGYQLLIRNAGRGAYSGVGKTKHAGQSLSFNTLSPDWAQENSVPHWEQEKAIGFTPPHRRFHTDEHYDYGEGVFSYGWHKPGEHIRGTWLRQVLFVKGSEPKRTGYYVVIDSVTPTSDRPTRWRHPWHLSTEQLQLSFEDNSILMLDARAVLKITPVAPTTDTDIRVIAGQERPALLGWRVYGESAKPWKTPTYAWTAEGSFTRAWVIQMNRDKNALPVTRIEVERQAGPGEIAFTVWRRDGGSDLIVRRPPGSAPLVRDGVRLTGDVVVLSRDANGHIVNRFEIDGGEKSVAAAAGATPK